MWVLEGHVIKYLGLQISYHLPIEANFDKIILSLKSIFKNWGNKKVSIANKVLVANQIKLYSILMHVGILMCECDQMRGLVNNYIWGGKLEGTHAKVKWDMITLLVCKGGLKIIDPQTQVEALLVKLIVKGLSLGSEPWKDLLQRIAVLTHPQRKTRFTMPPNIN
jgi:hypothetical protein